MADLLETKQDGVAILTMNRPRQRNALNGALLAALGKALREAVITPAAAPAGPVEAPVVIDRAPGKGPKRPKSNKK